MKSFIGSLLSGLGLAGVMVWPGPCDLAAATDWSVDLEWNRSPDTQVAGYLILYRSASGSTSNAVDAGTNTFVTIPGLHEGETYLFVAKAYDAEGRQSVPSNEIPYTVPSPDPSLEPGKLYLAKNPQSAALSVTFRVAQGVTYVLQATQDFQSWASLGSVTGALSPNATLEDPQAPSFAWRFYRVVLVP